jgi:eukaryotic-like serine/threonine-protein kinase
VVSHACRCVGALLGCPQDNWGGGDRVEHLRPGDPGQIGGYRLVGRLTPGGMGEVFVGETPSHRKVVVKLLRPDLASDPEFLAN